MNAPATRCVLRDTLAQAAIRMQPRLCATKRTG